MFLQHIGKVEIDLRTPFLTETVSFHLFASQEDLDAFTKKTTEFMKDHEGVTMQPTMKMIPPSRYDLKMTVDEEFNLFVKAFGEFMKNAEICEAEERERLEGIKRLEQRVIAAINIAICTAASYYTWQYLKYEFK